MFGHRHPHRSARRPLRLAPVAALLAGVLALAAPSRPSQAEQEGGNTGAAAAATPAPHQIRVVGGLEALSQYIDQEVPFWTHRVPELTHGQVRAEIAAFDRSGIRGQEMLQLMRLGVVPFGTVLLGLAAGDEPELNALDLPVMNPDIATLRRTATIWRGRLAELLRERYGVELLAIYTYPAQVMFCRRPFTGLSDLSGRRIRTSSVGQSELVQAVGGVPVVTPFAEIVSAIRAGVVECAITGALSGNAIGLHEVTSHVSRLAISWGVAFFGANLAAWNALPAEAREQLRAGLAGLEEEIWQSAEQQMEQGLACNAGKPECRSGRPGRMTIVKESWQDENRRVQLLRDVVLPGWLQRCGGECAEGWNRFIAPHNGLWLRAD